MPSCWSSLVGLQALLEPKAKDQDYIKLPSLSLDDHPGEESPCCFKYDCSASGLDLLLLSERREPFQFKGSWNLTFGGVLSSRSLLNFRYSSLPID